MTENPKNQSIYIKEVLIINEACPHCHCSHSKLNNLAKPGAHPFQKLTGQKFFFRRPKHYNRYKCKRKFIPGQSKQAIRSQLQLNSNITELKDWMISQDVMQKLGISKRKLQTMRDNGTLPFGYLKNKTYYKVRDIEELLEKSYATTKAKTHGKK